MDYAVLLDHISVVRSKERGEDGAVWYVILGEPHERVSCPLHPKRTHHYERQPFRRGSNGFRLNATAQEITEDKANVWGWDGNENAPTLTPSFLAAKGRPYRMHSFLTAGQLKLCSDSTVILMDPATSCWDL